MALRIRFLLSLAILTFMAVYLFDKAVTQSVTTCINRQLNTAKLDDEVMLNISCATNGTVTFNWDIQGSTYVNTQVEYKCFCDQDYESQNIIITNWNDQPDFQGSLTIHNVTKSYCIVTGCGRSSGRISRYYHFPVQNCTLNFTECPSIVFSSSPSSSIVSMVSEITSTSIAMATSMSIYSSSISSSITSSSSIISLINPPLISPSSTTSTMSTTNFSTPLVSSNPTDKTSPPNVNRSAGSTSTVLTALVVFLVISSNIIIST